MKKQLVMLAAVAMAILALTLMIDNPASAGTKRIVDWDSVLTAWGTDDLAVDTTRVANVDLFGPIRVCNAGANTRFHRAIGALYVPVWTASDTDAMGARDTIIMKIYGYPNANICSVLVDSQIIVKTDSTAHTFTIDIDNDHVFAGATDTSGAGLWLPKDHSDVFLYDWWRVYFTRADSARVGMVEATDSAYMVGLTLWLRFEEEN